MKVACLLLAACGLAAASIIPVTPPTRQVDRQWLTRQEKIFSLLTWGQTEFKDQCGDWDIVNKKEYFKDEKVYEKFLKNYKEGFLPQDTSFTFYDYKAMKQSKNLFELFYVAKDFDTFYQAACWARKHVGFNMFQHVFSMAVFNRLDCQGLVVPPMYEIMPNYYVPADVLMEAYRAKMRGVNTWQGVYNFTGYKSYNTPNLYHDEKEYRVSYFREDVALNDFFSRWYKYWSTMVNEVKLGFNQYHKRGEIFYYFHQQLLARYYLERLSNGLSNVEYGHYSAPSWYGYNPNTIDYQGNYMMTRPDNFVVTDKEFYRTAWTKSGERKIIDSIEAGVWLADNFTYYMTNDGFDGTDEIGKAIFGAPNSANQKYYNGFGENFLTSFAHTIKTSVGQSDIPTAFGTFSTILRDPEYYNLLKYVMSLFNMNKKLLHPYTVNELRYPELKIESVEFDKLTTYFDKFEYDITYGLTFSDQENKDDFTYTMKQHRLNRKPFNYKIVVNAEEPKSPRYMVRTFVGPKYDSVGREMDFVSARKAFFEIDRFPVQLQRGQNVFVRSFNDSTVFERDHMPSRKFRQYMQKFSTYSEGLHCGFPSHLQLPKGTKGGMPYMFYTIITPWETVYPTIEGERYFENFVLCGGSRYDDGRAYGYPFDRKVYVPEYFSVPNSYMKEVPIYHKEETDFFNNM